MLRRALLAGAVVVGSLSGALVALGPAGAADPTQFTFIADQNLTHRKEGPAHPAWSGPTNWVSPVNYANGRMFMRLEILSKPSSRLVSMKVCMWRDNYKYETCSPGQRLTDEGVYWVDLKTPANWWKLNNVYDWSKIFDELSIMVIDVQTDKLLQTRLCGPYCYPGTDIDLHTPISMRAGVVVVAPGATLQAPSSWKGCPSTWSPTCPGGTGSTSSTNATTSTTSGSTSSTNATTSTTSRSSSTTAASTTSTSRQPASKKAALITGNAASVPSADRAVRTRLQGLGYTVTAVDDDGLTSGQLTGHDVVVVSSSVLPSKIPTWLATLAVPVVNAEGYAHSRLRIASSGGEVAGQTAVNVVTSTHPIAGGLSGTQAVHTKALPVSSATPAPGAVTVARVPSSTKATVFAIDKGRALTSGTAPARRVGIHFSYASPTASTTNGWALFDRAVIWADG